MNRMDYWAGIALQNYFQSEEKQKALKKLLGRVPERPDIVKYAWNWAESMENGRSGWAKIVDSPTYLTGKDIEEALSRAVVEACRRGDLSGVPS